MKMTLEYALLEMDIEHRKRKAEKFNTSKINLNATGEELREILGNLQGHEISKGEFKNIKDCMNELKWTLEDIIEYRNYLDNKATRIISYVCCSKDGLESKRAKHRHYYDKVVENIEDATGWIAKEDYRWENDYKISGIHANRLYPIKIRNDDYQAPYIVDDFGRESYIFLAHEGDFITQKSTRHIGSMLEPTN